MTDFAISTNRLTKEYGNGRGVRDVSFRIGNGEAFGFLGPNGAGKSTIVKMLVGLIKPTAGNARIFGMAAGSVEARRRIGYLPELFRYPDWLSGEEVLHFHAKLCGLDRVTAKARIFKLLDEVGIGGRGQDRIKGYSKGMQQRLGLASALLGDPDIVFLDEPASALDPVGRYEVRELLIRLRGQGKTIFLNSHLLEDVEQLCDRVALLNNGTILTEGSISEMLRSRNLWRMRVGGFSPIVVDWLKEVTGLSVAVVQTEEMLASGDGTVWLEMEVDHEEQIGLMNYRLIEQGLTLYESHKSSSKLDEWFLQAVSGLEHRGERR
ncbi:MAG: ABC transporter ATP-binding protein [Candidatus Pristimantibacillus sp.]